MSTKCKSCQREVPDNATFCPWCGQKQIREKKRSGVIKVPEPTQLPSGNWRIYLRAEQRSITEPSKDLCLARAKAIRAGFLAEQKKIPKNAQTLRQAIRQYIATYEEPLSPATVRGYDIICRHRFPEKIDSPLADTEGWQEVIDNACKKYAPKTVYNSWGLVVTVMNEYNVRPPKVRLPQKKTKDMGWLTYSQILVFLDAVKGKKCEAGALFALHSLRRSEVCAMTWDNIDLKKGRITVQGSVVQNKDNEYVHKSTNKTIESARTIRIMIPRLKEILVQQKEAGLPPVLSSPNSITDSINTVCRSAGLPEVGTHGLRRSFASLGYHLNLSELEIQEMGGWKDYTTVRKIYTRLAKEDRLNAENRMETFYKTGGKEPAVAPSRTELKAE